LTPERWHDARTVAAQALPGEVLEQAADFDTTEQLERERDDLRQEDRQLRSVAERASDDELKALREQLEESERRQRELQQTLDNISVRQVPVYEHRAYLNRALREAQSRVLIVSPWIRFEVVNDELVGRFRRVLDRGVELWIGYGISKRGGYRAKSKGERDRDAERKLQRVADDYPTLFHMTRLGDTHAKVLVCDSRFSIVTSFNWLSFRGDDQLEFRDERGYYVGLSDQVDDLFDSYSRRFGEETDPKLNP
jgi:phosphatidylserine/phosphatidylglycerophosphate/cardiolipin synthase-like enzyme